MLSNNVTVDSLKTLLIEAKTPQERLKHRLDLDNYYRDFLLTDSVELTVELLHEAIDLKNEYVITDALRKLVMSVDRKKRVLTNDSVIEYLSLAGNVLSGERLKSFVTEVHLRHIRSKADWTEDENKTIEELTLRYNNPNEKVDDIYFQIERNYALGMAAALGISDSRLESYKSAQRYYDQLLALIEKLPVKYGAEILFWVNENIYVSYINTNQNQQVVDFVKKMKAILERYQELPEVKADVYQTFRYVQSLYNEGMARFPSIVGKTKAAECMQKADVMLREQGDLISLYFDYKGYYTELNDHKMVILYGDSIIGYMKSMDLPVTDALVSAIYKDQSECFAALNDHKRAYELAKQHAVLQEKISNDKSQNLRAEMNARYDLNHLALERERLSSKNRQIALIFSLFIVVLSAAWGISQRFHLNRLRKIQKELLESNEEVKRQSDKAMESEKMKTTFINSMCHEIRTPLNAINGFSCLLLDQTLEEDEKEEFPELIQKNTTLLTQLLEDLLQVANLSSSAEELPVEEANMHAICQHEMKRLQSADGKKSVEYLIDIADNCDVVRTNVLYLSQTIAHLLNNANKFTSSGTITLGCERTQTGKIEIRVSDTGVGIPADKHEWVFERFTKVDDFSQGAGLGLHICRLIVNRLGGTIAVDPSHTPGTSIVITLMG